MLGLLMLAMGMAFALPAWAEQKPFTRDQVQGLVRDGLGDESGAKLIEQRGIDFTPGEDFLQSLKVAGAGEPFLQALRAAKHPGPATTEKPFNEVQVLVLLAGQVPSQRVAMLVKERGLDFAPQQDYLDAVGLAGGDDVLIIGLASAKVTKPPTADPATEARQTQVWQHVARGADLARKAQYEQAEAEYRRALQLDAQDADLYACLAGVLSQQQKWGEAASAARKALGLNPNDDLAHSTLGTALGGKGDWDGAIAEEHEALRLNPNNKRAHATLAIALELKGDLQGAMEEYRAAYILDPKDVFYKSSYERMLQKVNQ
jgi:tetratricopeptide (TPR) repeat protein